MAIISNISTAVTYGYSPVVGTYIQAIGIIIALCGAFGFIWFLYSLRRPREEDD